MFKVRESVQLLPDTCKFTLSEGGLISLDMVNAEGEAEHYERVVAVRAFPLTAPDEFISLRKPDTKEKGHGKEVGFIRYLNEFDAETQKLINDELDRRYFVPEIFKIKKMKEKYGYSYWDVVTSAGDITFVVVNPTGNIRSLEDDRVLMYDIDGNVFQILDAEKLDKASYKKIEIYL
jgi:hypothetical protein